MISIPSPCAANGTVYTAANMSSAPSTEIWGVQSTVTAPAVNTTAPKECVYSVDMHNFWTFERFFRENFDGGCTTEGGSRTLLCNQQWWLEALHNNFSATFTSVDSHMKEFTKSLTRKTRLGMGRGPRVPDNDAYAAVSVDGVTLHTTTCFAVDLRWLSLPSILTLLVAGLLFWALLQHSRRQDGELAWKSSLLPLLYYKERFLATDHLQPGPVAPPHGHGLMNLSEMERAASRVRVVFQGKTKGIESSNN
jgi:hypothetical protein